jgi:anti-sigma B factor antagonist
MDGLRVALVPGTRCLRLEGELDASTAPLLEEPLGEALTAGGPLVMDLSALNFMDSTGIHALVTAAEELARKGWCIYLHVDDGSVKNLMNVTGVDRLPNIHVVNHPGAITPAP